MGLAKNNDRVSTPIVNLQKERDRINEQIAEELRKYSKSQKFLWQKIPYLALQEQGRTGYSDPPMTAYEYGLWHIKGLFVDLETGELLDIHPTILANTSRVINLELEDLDAGAIVNRLTSDISTQEKDWPWDPIEKRRKWRRSMTERLHLNPISYKRGYIDPREFENASSMSIS